MATTWDKQWLRHTIALAEQAAADGCAPVGAALVTRDGYLVAEGRSQVRPVGDAAKTDSRVTIEHAELMLLLRNQTVLGKENPLTLFVSLEPCHMCMGSAIVARVGRVVWALDDYWGGATKLYDSGREYLQARMPELVRTPYPDLQAQAAKLWVEHLNQYNLPGYIERMLRWQARMVENG